MFFFPLKHFCFVFLFSLFQSVWRRSGWSSVSRWDAQDGGGLTGSVEGQPHWHFPSKLFKWSASSPCFKTGLFHLASGAFKQCNTALLALSALRLTVIKSSFVCQILFNFPPVQELESNVSDIVEEILTVHDTTKVCVFGGGCWNVFGYKNVSVVYFNAFALYP